MTSFYRLSGGGNDFLALVEPESQPGAAEITAWCRRGVSLGADGLFVLRRDGDVVDMQHFNADGGAAAQCLNGTRCAARLAREIGWAAETVRIRTGAGVVEARDLEGERVELALPAPDSAVAEVDLDVEGVPTRGYRLVVGVPHLIIPWSGGLGSAPVATAGPILRHSEQAGPEGANVDFVTYSAPHDVQIRTYERGVEAETLACGTGVMAAAVLGVSMGAVQLPVAALTAGGHLLEVAPAAGDPATWLLRGDARLLAKGEIRPGALDVPSPPDWG